MRVLMENFTFNVRLSSDHRCASLLVLEDLHEVLDLNYAILHGFVRLSLFYHRLKFLQCHVFSKFDGDALQILQGDMVFFLGKENERFLKLGLTVSFRHLGRHYVKEVVVVNRNYSLLVLIVVSTLSVVAELRDQSLNLLLGWLEAQSA